MALTDKIPPEWNAPGIEPPDSKKDAGFEADDLVPAGWLNWFMTGVSAFLQDAQENGASTAWVQEQINKIAIPLIDSNTSTSKTSAPTADALRRTVESMNEALGLKQNNVRLADNWLAASVLVNAAPDAQGRAYPDGFSFFKVSSSTGAWPTSNGYVVTMRAGSGGFQLYFEMYTGATQTDKSSRFWYRSKRDSNTFWQDFTRVATEADLALKMDAARPSNMIPNSTGILGLTGWRNTGAAAVWNAFRDSSGQVPAYFSMTESTGAAGKYLDSDLIPVNPGLQYTAAVNFTAATSAAGTMIFEVYGSNNALLVSLVNDANQGFHRKKITFTTPAGVGSVFIRIGSALNAPATNKIWSLLTLVRGSVDPYWNNDVDLYAHAVDYTKHEHWGSQSTGDGTNATGAAYLVSIPGAPPGGDLPDGFVVSFIPNVSNGGGDPLLKVNGCIAYALRRNTTTQFGNQALKPGTVYTFVKVNNYFLARSAVPFGNATAAQVLEGYTFQSENVPDLGTGTAKENRSGKGSFNIPGYYLTSDRLIAAFNLRLNSHIAMVGDPWTAAGKFMIYYDYRMKFFLRIGTSEVFLYIPPNGTVRQQLISIMVDISSKYAHVQAGTQIYSTNLSNYDLSLIYGLYARTEVGVNGYLECVGVTYFA